MSVNEDKVIERAKEELAQEEFRLAVEKAKKDLHLSLEVPAVFHVQLLFINHQRQYTTVEFNLPPGIYPSSTWLPTLIEDAYRNSLRSLRLSTKDLSWRKCTPQEFVAGTAGGQQVSVEREWAKPYSTNWAIQKLPEAPVIDEGTNDQ